MKIPDGKRDMSYLTNLLGASERLQIFNADLEKPETFSPAIQGCTGVFHTRILGEMWDLSEAYEVQWDRSYVIRKTLTEKAVTEFAENHGLDFVTVIPSWIHGPFISSHFPDSVKICMG
ncbi:vestitone reductase-like [Primulina eburnea]|uniref:vestitone reductase-like n=1 Tax=Primulina eburnea TaxID=1245227 RepID=UPI003C6C8466